MSTIKECNEDMYKMGVMLLSYYSWFVSRNLLAVVCCWFSKKPKDYANLMKMCFFCWDGIALTVITIKCTVILVSDEVKFCTYSN